MKSQKNTSVIFLRGKWEVEYSEYLTESHGWVLYEKFYKNALIWGFTEERQICFPGGKTAYEGVWNEYFNDRLHDTAAYSYFPEDGTQYFDRSDYSSDGFCNICRNDRYNIECIQENKYYLCTDTELTHRIKIKKTGMLKPGFYL